MVLVEKSNWKRNTGVFKIDSFFNWFYVPIGVWVLIWSQTLSFSQITLATAVGLLGGVLIELPSGALADLMGRKKTIILGRCVLLVGYVLLAFRPGFVGFLIWNIFYQADGALNSGAQSALLYDSLKENEEEKRYKKVESDTFFLNTIGMAFGSVLGGLLYNIHYFLPYLIMIPVSACGLITSLAYQEPQLDSETFSLKGYVRQNIEGVKHIFSFPSITAVSLFSIAVNIVAYTGIWYYYEPRLAAGNFPPELLSILVAGTYAMRALGTRMIPIVDARISESKTPIFLAVFQTFASGLSFIEGRFGAITSVYARKASDGYRHPTLMSLQNDQIDSRYRATALSAISLCTSLMVSLLGLFIGKSLDSWGAANTMGVFALFGIFIVIPLSIRLSKQLANTTRS